MDKKPCPICGKEISATAKKCPYCNEWLTDAADGEEPVQQPENQESVKGFFETYFVNTFIRRYADFSGYASRKEFWLSNVALTVVMSGLSGAALLISALGGITGITVALIIMSLVSLALPVPGLAMSCRRLRDGGFSPWLILLSIIPVLGALALLVMFCLPSKQAHEQSSGSRFGITDTITTVGCVLLLIAGMWFSLRSIASELSSIYDYGDYNGYYIDESDYYTEPVEEVCPVEEVVAVEEVEGDAAIDACGFYEGKGKIDGKYPVRIQLQVSQYDNYVDDYYVTGRYAYESTLSKYGNVDSSWLLIEGKLSDMDGELTLLTYTQDSPEPLEEITAQASDYYSGMINASGVLTNIETGRNYTLSFECESK